MKRRIAVILLGALIVVFAGAGVRFSRWKKSATARLAAGSTLAQTDRGPVEYATVGEGATVLVLHGALGGYDQSMVISNLLDTKKFKFIAVSRAGYLRTPVASGSTPAEQADAYSALLDELQIPNVAVIAISAGGPSALEFALRHPNKCRRLVLLSAITGRLKVPDEDIPPGISLVTSSFADLGGWLAVETMRWKPRWVARGLFKPSDMRTLDDPGKIEIFRQLVNSSFPFSLRRKGFLNDRYIETLEPLPLGDIETPTLVLHGTADEIVPPAQAESAAGLIPNAELLKIEDGGHLMVVTHRELVIPALEKFLQVNAQDGSKERR
jgi:pimeloyl-ACP methyl ester carboxylesterase